MGTRFSSSQEDNGEREDSAFQVQHSEASSGINSSTLAFNTTNNISTHIVPGTKIIQNTKRNIQPPSDRDLETLNFTIDEDGNEVGPLEDDDEILICPVWSIEAGGE